MATKKNIEFIRGETKTITLEMEPETLAQAEMLRFTIKPAYDNDLSDGAAVVSKDFTPPEDTADGIWALNINPEDTIDIEPGKYVYDLVMTLAGNRVTLLNGKITIKAAVTLRGVK